MGTGRLFRDRIEQITEKKRNYDAFVPHAELSRMCNDWIKTARFC